MVLFWKYLEEVSNTNVQNTYSDKTYRVCGMLNVWEEKESIFRPTHASEASMLFPILTEVHYLYFYETNLSEACRRRATLTFQFLQLVRFNLFISFWQVLGPLSEEEVSQSSRLINLFYSFMLDGKPGKQLGEFEGWLPFAGKVN